MQKNMIKSEELPLLLPDDVYNRTLLANVHPASWRNPTPQGRYNLVVIGGGSAGLVAAVGAAGLGAKVALVERHLLGGDCLNVGCVPSKTIIRSAKVLGELARGPALGVRMPLPVEVDFGAVMERMRRVRAEISEHDSAARFRDLGIDVFLGEGAFADDHTVTVGGAALKFRRAVIATGSRASVPPIPGLGEAGYLTNESVWELTALPRRLAVIGGGAIGAELAQAFRRLGSEVTILEVAPRLLGREDADAAELIRTGFLAEGINLALGAQIEKVERTAGERRIYYRQGEQARILLVDAILVAAGRTPNLDTLNLPAGGIESDKQGVKVDDTLRTTNPAVYAAGDVATRFQFTHTADATARLVVQNALFPGPRKKVTDLIVPWCTYTDPEVAHVGLYDHEAEAQGMQVQTFVQPIGSTDRGRADGDAEGFVKVHVRRGSDRILGATIVARHAGELISEVTVAMAGGVGLQKLATVIHPYPTQAEAIKKVADAYNRTRLTPIVQRLFGWWLALRR
jgi:pyruvate/2-oxoglutarate dehydrogenase complex dihydrolipoamide dehydrogenase (E3) component